MKTPATKLRIFAGFPSYGGNGGISSEVPDIREWWADTILKIQADPRIEAIKPHEVASPVRVTGKVAHLTIGDTPITHVRNKFVRHARQCGADLLLMIDSDQGMLRHVGEPGHVDFFDAAFNAIYDHYGKGPLCIGAPYCGPPNGTENVYVFQWGNYGVRGSETRFSLDQYSRAEAAKMKGVQECAALPTGAILIDLRCFDLIEPSSLPKRTILEKLQSGQMTLDEAEAALRDGFFYYEWNDQYADQKASTEDVTCTRDISLAGQAVLGYNPVRCAWDSWVGHWKPWNVGRPGFYGVDQIASNFKQAVLANQHSRDRIIHLASADEFRRELEATRAKYKPNGSANGNGHVHVQSPNAEPEEIKQGLHWTDIHVTSAKDRLALVALVKEVLAEKHECRVLEVGSWIGGTAIPMANAGATVFCVDTWNGTDNDRTGFIADYAKEHDKADAVFEKFKENVGDKLYKSIIPKRATSQEAASWGWPGGFDIIFLDADHEYEAIGADIDAWSKHLAPGGIICGHDYGIDDFPGVKKAVDERFGSRVDLTHGEWLWVVRPQEEAAAR